MENWGVNGGIPASEVDVGFKVTSDRFLTVFGQCERWMGERGPLALSTPSDDADGAKSRDRSSSAVDMQRWKTIGADPFFYAR